MRVRMIRPSWWTDDDLHLRLTAEQREFYIGLWMLADDEGFADWNPVRIGAELYPFRRPQWWRRTLPVWLATLGATHAVLLPCGRHVFLPALKRYQTVPRPSSNIQRAHQECRWEQVGPLGATGAQVGPPGATGEQVLKGREGKEREDNYIAGAPAPAREASGGPPRGFAARAEAVLADPSSSAEAKAGAQAMLDLRRDR